MIIESLTLNNFGAYKGRQFFDLVPEDEKKPIILIGALNGSGKTTFLNSIQLCLYGNNAPQVKLSKMSYSDYLKNKINRSVDKQEGASIRVNLIIEENSESETLSIERRWAENENGKIKEKVLILRNGEEDKSLLDNWFQYIENLLPLSTMPLFFFDGEKLEDLANPDKSSGIIRSAVDGLLGLDLIDQCKSDLDIFISKKAKDVFDKETLKEIKVKEDSIKEVQDKFPYLNNQMQKIEEQIDIITSDIETYKLEFKKKGGEVYQAKEKLTNEKHETEIDKNIKINSLLELVSDSAPLLLIPDLLKDVLDLDKVESQNDENKKEIKVLDGFQDELLSEISNDFSTKDQIKIEKFFEKKITKLKDNIFEADHFKLSVLSQEYLTKILKDKESRRKELNKSIRSLESLNEEIIRIEKNINEIPSLEIIKPIQDQISVHEKEKAVLLFKIQQLRDEIVMEKKKEEDLQKSLKNNINKAIEQETAESDLSRFINFSEKAKDTLQIFKKTLITKKSERIESEILDCFKLLIRKKAMISKVTLDKDNYNLKLYNSKGLEIFYEDLSVGERQLLAVSILWALAKISKQNLPIIIDTPLARLDNIHRDKLGKRYFPHASHQVIILSTDAEVNNKYYDMIKPSMSRSFIVEHNEAVGGSAVQEGYFGA